LSADGSVGYLFESAATPRWIFLDNPSARAVIVVREPVARAWSDYRYRAHAYVSHRLSFAKVTLEAAARLAADSCLGPRALQGTLRQAREAEAAAAQARGAGRHAEAGEILSRAMRGGAWPSDRFYLSDCGRVDQDANELVKRSLYAFMVLHWRLALGGPGKVLVLDAQSLDLDQVTTRPNPKATPKADPGNAAAAEEEKEEEKEEELGYRLVEAALARVVDFAQLCPHAFEREHLRAKRNVDRREVKVKQLYRNTEATGAEGGGGQGSGGGIPANLRIGSWAATKLGEFFEPYDRALYELAGLDFQWARQRARAWGRTSSEARIRGFP